MGKMGQSTGERQFQLNPQLIMNSLKIARVALRARPAAIKAPLLRRGYAEAVSDKIKLSLVLPHQSIYKSQGVLPLWRICNCPAKLGIEHQRRRGFPVGGLQHWERSITNLGGTEDCWWKRERAGYRRGE